MVFSKCGFDSVIIVDNSWFFFRGGFLIMVELYYEELN